MNALRQRLLQECPPLHTALENSWAIANDKWLASIPTSMGSYNSGPHFRNIENHLESLLIPWSSHGKPEPWRVELSTLEVYLLLASVLFHDYGRVDGDDNHAYKSRDLLSINYASLGIPSRELAESLGRIAVYHDPILKPRKAEAKKRSFKIDVENAEIAKERDLKRNARIAKEAERKRSQILSARQALSEITIEPYGRARELHVATLLALADHMDASVNRTEPYFVRPDGQVAFKGAFRRMVVGTSYNENTRCIETCLCVPNESVNSGRRNRRIR